MQRDKTSEAMRKNLDTRKTDDLLDLRDTALRSHEFEGGICNKRELRLVVHHVFGYFFSF